MLRWPAALQAHSVPRHFATAIAPTVALLVATQTLAEPGPVAPAPAPAPTAAAPTLSPPASPSTVPPGPAPLGPVRQAHSSFSQDAAPSRVANAVSELAAWATSTKARVGGAVIDVTTGALLAATDEHRLMNPASNTKVLTAATVLDRMGPDFRFTTGLFGSVENGIVHALVLRGTGDPSLQTSDLFQLATALRALGVQHVESVLVDQSHFDGNFVPPAFDQQPNEWAPFRAPVSAVALERNTVTLNVVPTRAGSATTAWFDPPGFVDVHGSITTRPPGTKDGVRMTLVANGSRLSAELAGFLGEGSPRLRFSKRIDDPRLFAGYVLAEILRELGIDVRGGVAAGGENAHSRLAYVESAPLAVLVRELGKNSDNFYAETLLKDLGGFEHPGPARTEDGATAVLTWMKEVGALEPDTRLVNGSGLFDANRVSTFSLATALREAYVSPRIGPDFVAQLAVGGVDGTLHARFRPYAAKRVVRAKTGTLDEVVALSGYVLAPSGRSPIAFSFIVDDVAGRHTEARERIDKCVETIAASLWAR